jgi:hypothetical protein
MFYLFSSLPILNLLSSEQDLLVSRQLVGWWAAFARTGVPAHPADWPPVAATDDPRFWRIEAQSRMEERRDLLERFARWTEVVEKRNAGLH